MTVVRELVTKLGFQVDRTGLDKFEKSIVGFKTKFAIASAAATAFVKKTLDYFSDISKAAQDTEFLAKQTGIATEKFVALRKAAQEFQLEPNKFDQYFSTLNTALRDAQVGSGKLYEILQKSRDRLSGVAKLNLFPFAEKNDVEGAFKAIIDYVGSLDDIAEKARVLEHIFGDVDRGLFSIIEQGSKAFEVATARNKEFGESFVANIPKTKEYEKTLNGFYTELEKLQTAFVEEVLPGINKAVEFTTEGIRGIGVIKNEFKEGGASGGFGFLADAFKYAFKTLIGQDPLAELKAELEADQADFQRRLGEYQRQQQINKGPTTITNRIDISVGPGTTEEQAKIMAGEVRAQMENFWDQKTREVINDNPQVE